MEKLSDEKICPFCKSTNLTDKLTSNGYEWCEDCKMPFLNYENGFVSIRIKDFENSYISRKSFDDLKSDLLSTRKELAELQSRLLDCEDCLISMVEQYCSDTPDGVYSHDFMNAGETTFDYLLKYKLAAYAPDRGEDIVLLPRQSKENENE